MKIERNTECLICGKKSQLVMCNDCVKKHKCRHIWAKHNFVIHKFMLFAKLCEKCGKVETEVIQIEED